MMGVVAWGRAEAASVSADLAVSVTVFDQCLIHSASRSASCTGGAVYAVDVRRDGASPVNTDQLTMAGERAHTTADGQGIATSRALSSGDGPRHDAAAGDGLRTVSAEDAAGPIRVTYSF
jgi:hypothetical protein